MKTSADVIKFITAARSIQANEPDTVTVRFEGGYDDADKKETKDAKTKQNGPTIVRNDPNIA